MRVKAYVQVITSMEIEKEVDINFDPTLEIEFEAFNLRKSGEGNTEVRIVSMEIDGVKATGY